MNPNTQLTDDTIDLRELFFTIILQWKLIAFCIVLALICAGIYLSVVEKVYSVDAKIQVIDSKQNGLAGLSSQLASLGSLAGVNLGGLANGQQSTQTEIEILQSRSVLAKTIQDLNLNIQIEPKQSFLQEDFTTDKFHTYYKKNEIQISDRNKSFSIQQWSIEF